MRHDESYPDGAQGKAGAAELPRDRMARDLLDLTPDARATLHEAERQGLAELVAVNLPLGVAGDCNHYGWPIATAIGDTLIVMHRRIPGHNPAHAGGPDEAMSYGIVLHSTDGGATFSEPYDLRDSMSAQDRRRGGIVPLSHRAKFDKQNRSRRGYKVHLHAIGATRDGAVVAINNHGVFRSEDAGRSWTHFSDALREDTFDHPIVNLGPRLIDHPTQGLLAFGNWMTSPLSEQFVVLRSRDGGASWQVEQHHAGFPQYEPAGMLYGERLLFVTRDQTQVNSHQQLTFAPGRPLVVTPTNLKDPRYVDTVDLSHNPVTGRFELVRSERHAMELWLWSMAPEDWSTGQWRRECRLLGSAGEFWKTADGFHPAGAVIDRNRGVQHVFLYAGRPDGPAGVFRLTRSLDTPRLRQAMGASP